MQQMSKVTSLAIPVKTREWIVSVYLWKKETVVSTRSACTTIAKTTEGCPALPALDRVTEAQNYARTLCFTTSKVVPQKTFPGVEGRPCHCMLARQKHRGGLQRRGLQYDVESWLVILKKSWTATSGRQFYQVPWIDFNLWNLYWFFMIIVCCLDFWNWLSVKCRYTFLSKRLCIRVSNERILWGGGNVSIGFSTSQMLENFEAWMMWKINTHISDLTVFTLLKVTKVVKIEGNI